jgi:hypothetical protein
LKKPQGTPTVHFRMALQQVRRENFGGAVSDLFDELYDTLPWGLYVWFMEVMQVLERNLRVQ